MIPVQFLIGAAVVAAVSIGTYIYGQNQYKAGAQSVQVVLERERANAAGAAVAETERRRKIEQEAADNEAAILARAEVERAELLNRLQRSDAARRVLDAAVTNYAKAGFIGASPSDSAADLAVRAETLGQLVIERNEMAGRCEAEVEQCGSAFRVCRAHAEIVEQMRKELQTDVP